MRVVAVWTTASGDLSLFRFLAQHPEIELTVLFSYRDESGRGSPGREDFRAVHLRGWALHRNTATAISQVWNPRLVRHLARLKPEALFVSGYANLAVLRAILWAERHAVPWVSFSDSRGINRGSTLKRLLKRAILRPILRRGSGFLAYGRGGKTYLRHYGARAPIATVFSNRDLHALADRTDVIRATHGQESAFVFLGRLVEEKGVSDLLQAFEEAVGELAGWTLLLAGDGPLRGKVREAASHLPIEAVGAIPFERIPELFARSAVLVLPSRCEPWGEVVPEGMAGALPVIVSDAVGAAELVEHGVTGWTFPHGDVGALKECLRTASSANLRDMGQNARERILNVDVQSTARSLVEILLKVSGSGWARIRR